ncbi:hypothetical protein Pryu01_02432 [Paraliobacillus ryukyuensis]|uniref:DNA-binding XRE family transcriptional regulator n=1 Tax=Paraliobacillus ryukyuensis TaxID=200904 RepID=A0A366DU11_9BACI|nr:helix-turn-helix transcriptional regulator [Paraliobacillus ryukyuensis]RBO93581.1 DNA-binding XRE family transcriptional regulator [Paraliobacillus ryukyuensis]
MIKMELTNRELTRVLIAEQGKNLKEFAQHINISQTYLTQILNGNRHPSPTVANKIAKGLNQQIKDIFTIENFTNDNRLNKLQQGGVRIAERSN